MLWNISPTDMRITAWIVPFALWVYDNGLLSFGHDIKDQIPTLPGLREALDAPKSHNFGIV